LDYYIVVLSFVSSAISCFINLAQIFATLKKKRVGSISLIWIFVQIPIYINFAITVAGENGIGFSVPFILCSVWSTALFIECIYFKWIENQRKKREVDDLDSDRKLISDDNQLYNTFEPTSLESKKNTL